MVLANLKRGLFVLIVTLDVLYPKGTEAQIKQVENESLMISKEDLILGKQASETYYSFNYEEGQMPLVISGSATASIEDVATEEAILNAKMQLLKYVNALYDKEYEKYSTFAQNKSLLNEFRKELYEITRTFSLPDFCLWERAVTMVNLKYEVAVKVALPLSQKRFEEIMKQALERAEKSSDLKK